MEERSKILHICNFEEVLLYIRFLARHAFDTERIHFSSIRRTEPFNAHERIMRSLTAKEINVNNNGINDILVRHWYIIVFEVICGIGQ